MKEIVLVMQKLNFFEPLVQVSSHIEYIILVQIVQLTRAQQRRWLSLARMSGDAACWLARWWLRALRRFAS